MSAWPSYLRLVLFAGFTGCITILMAVEASATVTDNVDDHNLDHSGCKEILFDFTDNATTLNDWVEISDVVRTVGMSKADFTLQKTQLFQRAIFFTLLNPQPNGAGFAGVRTRIKADLSKYENLALHVRAQGQAHDYKVVLNHHGVTDERNGTYEQTFEAPLNSFFTVQLPLKDFKPYFRGRPMKDAIPLDTSDITSFGLQIYGGVYEPKKQSGVSSLEIDWIGAR